MRFAQWIHVINRVKPEVLYRVKPGLYKVYIYIYFFLFTG